MDAVINFLNLKAALELGLITGEEFLEHSNLSESPNKDQD